MSLIRVIYVVDARFAALAEFSIASLLVMSRDPLCISIYKTEPFAPFQSGLADFARQHGHYLEEATLHVDRSAYSEVALHDHISLATLLKAEAIGKEAERCDRILFLDADVLACQSLSPEEIFTFPTTAGAVYDFVSYMPFDGQNLIRHREQEGASPDYFNAGVLAIDGKRWRERGLTKRYVDNLHRHVDFCPFRHDEHGRDPGDCKGADQCALNMTLEGDWTPIDFRWNVQKPLRHLPLWRAAYLRHYTGFRKFLAENPVNRDTIERKVLRQVSEQTGVKTSALKFADPGVLFLADRIKYRHTTAGYAERVELLEARADGLRSGLPVHDARAPLHIVEV